AEPLLQEIHRAREKRESRSAQDFSAGISRPSLVRETAHFTVRCRHCFCAFGVPLCRARTSTILLACRWLHCWLRSPCIIRCIAIRYGCKRRKKQQDRAQSDTV